MLMTSETQRAAQYRAALLLSLGGVCRGCGSPDRLEFHSLIEDGGRHHRMNPFDRVTFYRKLAAGGNVVVLCRVCHAAVSAFEASAGRLLVSACLREKVGLVSVSSSGFDLFCRLPSLVLGAHCSVSVDSMSSEALR